jgi:hypothetical protein
MSDKLQFVADPAYDKLKFVGHFRRIGVARP